MTFDPNTAALLVRLGDRQFGLPLSCVERVLPMAQVLPLPDAGESLLGMLNLHGNVLPVVDPHSRLGLDKPGVQAEHRLILLSGRAPFLMWVDDVDEVVVLSPEAFSDVPTLQTNPVVASVVRLGESIVPLLAPGALEPRDVAA
jgi:purine-binding chemotaxis protein CheW